MIFSLKKLKYKMVLLAAAVAVAGIVFCITTGTKTETPSEEGSSSLRAVDGEVNYSAASAEERLNFASRFGYTVNPEPYEVQEVKIPEEFDEVYKEYNNIQLEQGLDLTDYKGCSVKKWTYTITNYPGYENTDTVRINMLVYKGRVIGGDVSSVAIDGFMTGFAGE